MEKLPTLCPRKKKAFQTSSFALKPICWLGGGNQAQHGAWCLPPRPDYLSPQAVLCPSTRPLLFLGAHIPKGGVVGGWVGLALQGGARVRLAGSERVQSPPLLSCNFLSFQGQLSQPGHRGSAEAQKSRAASISPALPPVRAEQSGASGGVRCVSAECRGLKVCVLFLL